MTKDAPGREPALLAAIGDALLLTEVATDDELSLDTAAELPEAVAWSLRRLTSEQQSRISTLFRGVAESRSWDAYAGSATRTAIVREMPDLLGLVPTLNEWPSGAAILERDGPTAIS